MKIKDFVVEAANPAQQAAIAISMKKAGKKPKNETEVEERFQLPQRLGTKRDRFKSLRKEEVQEEPKFTGYFKGKDKPPVGDRLVGEEKKKSLRNTNPCWKGYHPVGTKKKNGRTVPNCVPESQTFVGLKPFSESELRAILGKPYIIEASAFEKGWEAVKAAPGMIAKITKLFQIFPRIMWDFLTTHAREAKQGTQAFGIWAQNQLCKIGRIDRCPTEEQLKWAINQRSDLGKMVAHFLLITVISSAVAVGVAHAGVADAVQSIPFGTEFNSIIAQLNDKFIADNLALGVLIKSMGFILKKSLWETILQGVEYFSKAFNINSVYNFFHNLHPSKDEVPNQSPNQKLNASAYESIVPGQAIRTLDMARRGIVENVELYRPFGELAVYFRTQDNILLRTPISNIVKIPQGV